VTWLQLLLHDRARCTLTIEIKKDLVLTEWSDD